MQLSEEDIGKVMNCDLPSREEFADIISTSQKAGMILQKGCEYSEFSELNFEAWEDLYRVMTCCIARGMRLAGERKYKECCGGNDE